MLEFAIIKQPIICGCILRPPNGIWLGGQIFTRFFFPTFVWTKSIWKLIFLVFYTCFYLKTGFYQWKLIFFWELKPRPAPECKLNKSFFAKFCHNFLAFSCFSSFFQLFCLKSVEKAYFAQHLEYALPKHWSK